MCGRYYNRSMKQEIAARMKAGKLGDFPLAPDYNIAPTTFQPVVRQERESGERELVALRWGLIPYFAKSMEAFRGFSTINARAETVATAPSYREPFKKRRCLVPADGFYEWATVGPAAVLAGSKVKENRKTPFAITLTNGEPLAFAGVSDAWREAGSETWLQSFSIITTEANELMAEVHTRMPVILRRRDWEEWLERESERPPVHLLRPYDAEAMQMKPCNPAVGNVRNNGEEMLVCPVSEEPLRLLNSA